MYQDPYQLSADLLVEQMQGDPEYQEAIQNLAKITEKYSQKINGVKPAQIKLSQFALEAQERIEADRGNKTFYGFTSSGMGNGPYVEALDGSIKLDFISGIGVYFDGYNHPQALRERISAATLGTTMQANLAFSKDYSRFLRRLLSHAQPVSRLRHGWTTLTGSMSNEMALKIIRQKKYPANKILAFADCFAGRTVMMAEITDSPDKRVDQKSYSEVLYVPFYDARNPNSIEDSVKVLQEHIKRYGPHIAAFIFELIQGEGGFREAPAQFFKALFEICRQNKILLWDDEVQTFGRSGTLFAFERLGLGDYIDIVTVGKLLQSCSVLWTAEINPKAGLIAGTFVGSTASLRLGYHVLKRLTEEGYLGPQGKIEELGRYFVAGLQKLSQELGPEFICDVNSIGGMIAAQVFDGDNTRTQEFVKFLYKKGLMVFYCGHGPYRLRFLPPMLNLEKKHLDEAVEIIKNSLKEFKETTGK